MGALIILGGVAYTYEVPYPYWNQINFLQIEIALLKELIGGLNGNGELIGDIKPPLSVVIVRFYI